jgi:2'-5' RNA ligase
MNKRLSDIYYDIEKNNLDDFLGNKLKLDEAWKKSIWGVALQINLGDGVKNVVEDFQKKLNEMEQGNLLLLPRKYQHISFNQVVFWNGDYKAGKQKTWDGIRDSFLESFREMDNKFSSFEVTFSKLIATTGGIMWCGYDEADELEKLREYFLEKLPFPDETTYLNHIIHTTVARFKRKLRNPKKVLVYVQSQKRQATMRVDKIVLRNELVFPSIKTKNIAEISLK